MSHPELAAEQAYVDHAYGCLERMRETLVRAADAADGEVAQLALEAYTARRLQTIADAERGLLFGRLDLEAVPRPLYVGRRWVHDDEQDVVAVNWQAPAARPFYTATPADPQRVTLRRRFRTRGRELLDISDETLDGSTIDGAGVQDFLLEELEQSRAEHMRDIVATIQSDQYRLITYDRDRPLVVQGGPGTGKTAVGLHRASWLLYTHRDELTRSGVLVIGPNRTFMEYVSHVLPTLGEEAVEQRAVGELVDGVRAERTDPPEVARLKGDARMAEVIRAAVAPRFAAAKADGMLLRLDGSFIEVKPAAVAELAASIRAEQGLTRAARERFRMELLRRFYSRYGTVLGASAMRSFEEVERAVKTGGYLNRIVDRAWPLVDAERLVRGLLTSRARLAEAADGILDEDEQRLLLGSRPRRGEGWSESDVPLLDEAHELVTATPKTYGHVIVDEAQDLTPMQLRMVARRAPSGSVTILGDIAQATGPIEYARWHELLALLPEGGAGALEELRHAYRVPSEIMELALPLLARIAPDVEPPLAFRTGAAPPTLRRVREQELLAEAFREACALARQEGLLAVIVPAELLEPALATRSLFDDAVPLLTPREAKGLEFDHVVVVEPALIAADIQGLRQLYVALTRPTRTLVVVHARDLPAGLR
jgi:DNA helicase IV